MELPSLDAWITRAPDMPSVNSELGVPYVCCQCDWTGRSGVRAYLHHAEDHHAVRGRDWPAYWPDLRFSCCGEDSALDVPALPDPAMTPAEADDANSKRDAAIADTIAEEQDDES